MQRALTGMFLFVLAGAAHAQTAGNCGSIAGSSLPVQPTLIAPLSPELIAPTHQLGAPTGVLAQAFDETLAVDNVLMRQRVENCLALAKATPASAPALPSGIESRCLQAADAVRQHAVALQHEPGRQAHDRRRIRCLDEGAGCARGEGCQGRPGRPCCRSDAAGRAVQAARTEEVSPKGIAMAAGAARHGLARVLSKRGVCSRAEAARWIVAGRVSVDGRIVRDPEFPISGHGRQRIVVDGRELGDAARLYLMLNKPRGLVTTARDERSRDTVYRCFEGAQWQGQPLPWLAPVGRLDQASEGLLLFCNDPEWAARVTDPHSGPDKTYHVQVDTIPDEALLAALTVGVDARRGHAPRAVGSGIACGGTQCLAGNRPGRRPQPADPALARCLRCRGAQAGAGGNRRPGARRPAEGPVAMAGCRRSGGTGRAFRATRLAIAPGVPWECAALHATGNRRVADLPSLLRNVPARTLFAPAK